MGLRAHLCKRLRTQEAAGLQSGQGTVRRAGGGQRPPGAGTQAGTDAPARAGAQAQD